MSNLICPLLECKYATVGLQFKTEPAWGLDIELRSSGSMASSGTDGCVPDVNQCSLPYIAVKSEACVPDYHNGCDDSPCMPPMQVQPTYTHA